MFVTNFQLKFSKRYEGPIFNKGHIYMSAFKRLMDKNFNQMSSIFMKIILNTFFVKNDNLFRDVSTNICKISFVNSPNVFSLEASFPKCI